MFSLVLQLAATAALAQMPRLFTTPMIDCNGLPCVEVTVTRGKTLRLLIDTGNSNSVLDTAVAKRMGLEVTPVMRADGKTPAGYGRAVLPGVKLGDGLLGDVTFLIFDLSDDIKREHMPAADGTLCYTPFKGRLLKLDYKARLVGVSEPLARDLECPGFCGEITTPTFGKKGPPIVVTTGFSVNGKPITAQVDTMFTGTMLIFSTSVEKLGLGQPSASTRKEFFKYTDEGVEMISGSAKSESFGDRVLASDAPLYFTTPAVHQPDGMFDATVGHALFRNSALWLDFHDMRMWLSE